MTTNTTNTPATALIGISALYSPFDPSSGQCPQTTPPPETSVRSTVTDVVALVRGDQVTSEAS